MSVDRRMMGVDIRRKSLKIFYMKQVKDMRSLRMGNELVLSV